jgi:hypothetical protein
LISFIHTESTSKQTPESEKELNRLHSASQDM